MSKVIYYGIFDPVTYTQLDIFLRACMMIYE